MKCEQVVFNCVLADTVRGNWIDWIVLRHRHPIWLPIAGACSSDINETLSSVGNGGFDTIDSPKNVYLRVENFPADAPAHIHLCRVMIHNNRLFDGENALDCFAIPNIARIE